MDRTSAAALGIAAIAALASLVNITRTGRFTERIAALEKPAADGAATGGGTRDPRKDLPVVAAEELKRLRTEMADLKTEIEKVRTAGVSSGTGTGTNGGSETAGGAALTASDVVRVMDQELKKRWREGRMVEIEARARKMAKLAEERATKLKLSLNLSEEEAARVAAVINDQVAAYTAAFKEGVEATPEVLQASLDKVTEESEVKLKALLTPAQQQRYAELPPGWHGIGQKTAKSDPNDKSGGNRR